MQCGMVAAATEVVDSSALLAAPTVVTVDIPRDVPAYRAPAAGSLAADASADIKPVPAAATSWTKQILDRSLAVFGLIVLAPLMLGIVLAVALSSRGPALFRQRRVGRDGQMFTMLKFRTMRAGAESELRDLIELNEVDGGVLFKLREDPRVTRIGRWLRRLSLDELPQLLNVVTGSMSLVGPRPQLPAEAVRSGPDALRRYSVRPGLTGLWQVSGRSDLSSDAALELDLRYVDEWSLGLDATLLLRTLGAVVRADGAY